ncbi:hypothetical protein JTE90_010853 [Oedothorax gibbosus]|uniref:Uncharacterized protein n=1 Tax=Oedothorax gibbosus TaxID=931172 RepID=A0AAV6V2U1_9ARAC|nr:hypothetical protein JTE90_010853 [Oedothorax gibbosus]
MFSHIRRSHSGCSLPSWLITPGPVLMKNHVHPNKYHPLVQEVELLEANPEYARVRFPDGRETTVNIRHLAPRGLQPPQVPANNRGSLDRPGPEHPLTRCDHLQSENPDKLESANVSPPEVFDMLPETENENQASELSPEISPKLSTSSRIRRRPAYLSRTM